MRILLAHNYYQTRGGEDLAYEQDLSLLRRNGFTVEQYTRHNDDIKLLSAGGKLRAFFNTSWSPQTIRECSSVIERFRPDILHVHNYFPLISPSIFWISAKYGVPTILTIHDYRLICPLGWFFRLGRVCEDCISGNLLPSLIHKCYHKSFLHTLAIVQMIQIHRLLGTWRRKVDCTIFVSEFLREKMKTMHLPLEKTVVRPNFLDVDPGVKTSPGSFALYAGRLSSEKGIQPLLEAWRHLPEIPLYLAGDGPLKEWAAKFLCLNQMHHVKLLGSLAHKELIDLMKNARFLVTPSQMCETFGRTIIEAFATGTPVLASHLGAFTELVKEGLNGMLFNPYSHDDLINKSRNLWNGAVDGNAFANNCRSTYLEAYSAEKAIKSISSIYNQTLDSYRKDHK